MAPSWTHLIRFIAVEDGQPHVGQIDPKAVPDVGLATFEGKKVAAKIINGTPFDGTLTDRTMHVKQVGEIANTWNVFEPCTPHDGTPYTIKRQQIKYDLGPVE